MTVEERLEAQERELQALRAELRARTVPRRFSGVTALAAAFLLGMTLTCAGRAYAVGQVPNHFEVRINVTPGTDSAPIDLPVHDTPITITCSSFLVNINEDFGATGFVHLTHHSAADILSWSGIHGNPSLGARMTVGSTKLRNTPIVIVAYFDRAELRSHADRSGVLRQIVVHPNLNTGDQVITVALQMIW